MTRSVLLRQHIAVVHEVELVAAQVLTCRATEDAGTGTFGCAAPDAPLLVMVDGVLEALTSDGAHAADAEGFCGGLAQIGVEQVAAYLGAECAVLPADIGGGEDDADGPIGGYGGHEYSLDQVSASAYSVTRYALQFYDMTITLPVKARVLSTRACDPYDVGDDPGEAGELMAPGEADHIAAIAGRLRREIYSGTWAVGSKVPSRKVLADEHGGSAESAGVALRILGDEGLVSLEPGRGTFVLARYRYWVHAHARWTQGEVTPQSEIDTATAAMTAAAANDPAVSGEELGIVISGDPRRGESIPGASVSMCVEAPDVARAVLRAYAVTRRAFGAPGWDLARARVGASPADGDDD